MEVNFEFSILDLQKFCIQRETWISDSKYFIKVCPYYNASVVEKANKAFFVRELESFANAFGDLGIKFVITDANMYCVEFTPRNLQGIAYDFLHNLSKRLRWRNDNQREWLDVDLVYEFAELRFMSVWECITEGQRKILLHRLLGGVYMPHLYAGVESFDALELESHAVKAVNTTDLVSNICRTVISKGIEFAIHGLLEEYRSKEEEY